MPEVIRGTLYVLLPLALVGVRILWRFFKEVNSEDWPIIHGKCTFAGVENKENHHELKILYSYKLPTEKWASCGAFHKDFFNQTTANQWAKALNEKEIPVHYHPNNPDKSNLMDSDLQAIVEQSKFNLKANPTSIHPTFVR
jgi:hypothetical protein